MDEQRDLMGFLGDDGVLYCSRTCAARRGTSAGNEVDTDEYEGLVEGGTVQAGGLCPVCGEEFAVCWPGREPD